MVKKVGSRRFTVTAADSTGAVEVSWQQAKEEGASHQRPPPRFNRSLSEYVLNNPPSISNLVNGVKGIESTSPALIAAYVFGICRNISSTACGLLLSNMNKLNAHYIEFWGEKWAKVSMVYSITKTLFLSCFF